MRIINCLIAMLLAQLCMSQQVTRKVKVSQNGDREIFYVLDSDNTILHGRYQRIERAARVEGLYKNGKQEGVWTEYSTGRGKFVRVQGPYKDGLRTGIWTVYNSRKKLRSKGSYQNDKRTGFWRFFNTNGELAEEGNFTNDLRTGKWSFYDEKSELVQEYDYTAKNVISDVSIAALQQTKFKVINGPDTMSTYLQRPPVYIGGRSKMNQPKIIQYKIDVDSVKVEIRFTVNKYGNVRDFTIVNKMGYPYDQEALFTVEKLPGAWAPALLNGEPVEVEHSLTVMFKKVYMKKEPTVYYRDFLPQTPVGYIPTRKYLPFAYSSGLSYHACRVQIL